MFTTSVGLVALAMTPAGAQGHLVQDVPEDIADHGIDARHEDIGESWLTDRFGPEVYEPVRLHVAAKRYDAVEKLSLAE
jgi:predicted HD phosphohydrolase